GGVCLHGGHELCGTGRGEQAALWHEPDGVCLATGGASPIGVRSGVERQCAWGNPAASARWHADSGGLGPGCPRASPPRDHGGAELPCGGYKGAAVAMMIELLAGALIGEVFSFEASALDNNDGGPPVGGELLIAFDPARCVGHGDRPRQLAHAERLFANILAQEGTRLPSDRRYAARQRTPTEGITIPRVLYEELQR